MKPQKSPKALSDPQDTDSFADRVEKTVRRIPLGTVLTYGDVAALAGRPRAARGVGSVLNRLPREIDLPWWRVISSTGRSTIRGPGGSMQRMLLEMEGIKFRGGKLDFRVYRWIP